MAWDASPLQRMRAHPQICGSRGKLADQRIPRVAARRRWSDLAQFWYEGGKRDRQRSAVRGPIVQFLDAGADGIGAARSAPKQMGR